MAYEAVVFGMGVVSAILAMIGIGIRDKEMEEDEELDRLQRHWYYILLDPSMIRLIFITSSIFFLLLTVAMVISIADKEGFTNIVLLAQGGYNALIFIMLIFVALSVLAILSGIMERLTKIGERRR